MSRQISKDFETYPARGMVVHGHDGVWHTGVPHYKRLISNLDYLFLRAVLTGAPALGVVYLYPIDLEFDVTIDRLGYLAGNVAAGNMRLGLYPRFVAGYPDLPNGGALIWESASLAVPGVNEIHWVTLPNQDLDAGTYFVAFQHDDATDEVVRTSAQWNHNVDGVTYPARTYAQAYGAFTTPCPVTATYGWLTPVYMRVV